MGFGRRIFLRFAGAHARGSLRWAIHGPGANPTVLTVVFRRLLPLGLLKLSLNGRDDSVDTRSSSSILARLRAFEGDGDASASGDLREEASRVAKSSNRQIGGYSIWSELPATDDSWSQSSDFLACRGFE